VPIDLPPLRERRETFWCWPSIFSGSTPGAIANPWPGFEPAALERLRQHAWPGNVRELDHAVERAALMADGKMVKPADLA